VCREIANRTLSEGVVNIKGMIMIKQQWYEDGTLKPCTVLSRRGVKHFLRDAYELAADVHSGQIYGDLPYMYHVIGVTAAVNKDGPLFQITALLHDVIEDSPVSLLTLEMRGYPDKVVQAVDLLTQRPEDTYSDYIARIAESDNVYAKVVKLADLRFNLAHQPQPTKVSGYHRALETILQARTPQETLHVR
jgi:(p)ppGpp synthase/HD superfamily hydrolase